MLKQNEIKTKKQKQEKKGRVSRFNNLFVYLWGEMKKKKKKKKDGFLNLCKMRNRRKL